VDFEDLLAELISAFHRMAVDQALGNDRDARDFRAGSGAALLSDRLLGHTATCRWRRTHAAGVEMTLLRMLAFAPG
jgi:hypothetical protein